MCLCDFVKFMFDSYNLTGKKKQISFAKESSTNTSLFIDNLTGLKKGISIFRQSITLLTGNLQKHSSISSIDPFAIGLFYLVLAVRDK